MDSHVESYATYQEGGAFRICILADVYATDVEFSNQSVWEVVRSYLIKCVQKGALSMICWIMYVRTYASSCTCA